MNTEFLARLENATYHQPNADKPPVKQPDAAEVQVSVKDLRDVISMVEDLHDDIEKALAANEPYLDTPQQMVEAVKKLKLARDTGEDKARAHGDMSSEDQEGLQGDAKGTADRVDTTKNRSQVEGNAPG